MSATENNIYYALNDGRLWDVSAGRFIATLPNNAEAIPCLDEQGNSSLEGLIGCLDFYGFDKGELKTDAEYAVEARVERDKLLAATDYLAMPDYPLTDEQRTVVLTYRQALRDVPEQEGFPRNINWPEKNF